MFLKITIENKLPQTGKWPMRSEGSLLCLWGELCSPRSREPGKSQQVSTWYGKSVHPANQS